MQNYDKMNIRTGHYTPIPAGFTPLRRPLKEYIKCVRFVLSIPLIHFLVNLNIYFRPLALKYAVACPWLSVSGRV